MAVDNKVRGVGHEVAGHPWFHRLARVGLGARGLLYLLIGWLALQIAFGNGGQEADRKGALVVVADKPGGKIILWVMAIGFAALALWQFAESRYGRPVPDGDKPRKRLSSAARGAVYAVGCAATVAFLLGSPASSSDKQSKALTARAMEQPGGRWLIFAVAAGFVVWGVAMLVKAARRKFLRDLKTGGMSRTAYRVVQTVGIVGHSARGLVAIAAGALFGYAAAEYQPDKAQGVDGTLREFADTPAGPWGLVAVAIGVLIFGLYSFCEARYRKVEAVHPTR
ncbi:DUF1206 domain-containing protein [Spirillospora albida]|uniref:DUF1206 domain-containing protein n=1 Tax=Spirillospora albida TaxID=58123 RepID=UPI0004BFEB1B|nr:DUF1206 domain-containing protein [Spirillospora albida]